MSLSGKSWAEWCCRENSHLVRISLHALLIFIGINGNLHKDLTSLAKLKAGQGDNYNKVKLIKKLEENYYNTDRGHSVNSQHILVLDLNFASYCSGQENFSYIWPENVLQTPAMMFFLSPCQGPQDLQAQLSKTSPQSIHTLARTPPSYFLTPNLSKANSQPQSLYTQMKWKIQAMSTQHSEDLGITKWVIVRPWSSTVWWTLAPKLLPNKFLSLYGPKLMQLCCFQHSS